MHTHFTLSPDQVKKFWSYVDQSDGADACWLWLGQRARYGYGMFYVDKRKQARANRIAWFLANGPIPDGLVIAHTCDQPSCTNPAHLVAITQLENIKDRDAKGRGYRGPNAPKWEPRENPWKALNLQNRARGERAHRSRLTADQVREIRQRYAAGEKGQEALAREYGVHKNAVWMIVHRKSWQHIA